MRHTMFNNSKYLESGEVVEHIIHRHILFEKNSWLSALTLLLVVDFFAWPLWQQGFYGQLIIGLFLGVAILTIMRSLLVWSQTRTLVTAKRLIDINLTGIFSKQVSIAYYNSIQDISWQKTGLFSTIFKYGSVAIIYGQSSVKLVLTYIKNPSQVANLISNKTKYD